MTPAEIELAARNNYNAVNESFWSQDEIFGLIWRACLEYSTIAKGIERTYSATTVAGTAEYSYPTNTISIRRVTYDGIKLEPIDQRTLDSMSLNSTSIPEGQPQYYTEWNNELTLFPTPDDALELKIWSYNEPDEVTNTSTLEIPTVFHGRLVNFVLSEMYAKDKDFPSAQYYRALWEKDLEEMKRWNKRRKRGDSFGTVINEDVINTVGMI